MKRYHYEGNGKTERVKQDWIAYLILVFTLYTGSDFLKILHRRILQLAALWYQKKQKHER